MLEMDDSIIKQLMDTQSQMLNSIQSMQTQTLTIIQQNTAALQGVQLNQNATPLVQASSEDKAPDIVPFSNFPQATVLNTGAPAITPSENLVSVSEAPTPSIAPQPDMVMINQNAQSAPNVSPVNMGPVMPNMSQAPLYTNPGLVSTNLYTAMPGSLNAQTQSTPTGLFKEFQSQDMGVISDVTNMFVDPRQYQAYSAVGNPLGYTVKRHMEFKGHLSSPTARQEFTEETTNAVTGNIMNAAGVIGEGAANLAGFFIPGPMLLSTGLGLAVGAAANVAIGETLRGGQVSQQYEDILRKQAYQFINPSEGMTEYGTVGLSRPQRHELGDYLRHLAPEKFLDDTQLQEMLAGALDNKLLKTVSDVETFKRRFSETVDAAKKIMQTMDMSIEEAMNFMGELEQRGMKTQQMPGIASNIKIASSYGYMAPGKGADMILSATDAITQGTALNAGDVATTMSQSVALANIVNEEVLVNDPRLYNYVKNAGGASQVGIQYETGLRQYADQTNMATAMFAPAFKPTLQSDGTTRLELDQEEFQRILFSGRSSTDLANDARAFMGNLSIQERELFYAQAPTLMNSALDSQTNLGGLGLFIQKMQNELSPVELDLGTALRRAGVYQSQEMADIAGKFSTAGADGNITDTIIAQSWQNELNTLPPGMLDKASAWYRGFMADTAGDVGSAMQSNISDAINEINMRLENISDMSSTERLSNLKIDLTDPELSSQKLLSREKLDSFNETINVSRVDAGADPLVTFAPMDDFGGVEGLTYEEFEDLKSQIEENGMTPEILSALSGFATGKFGSETQRRATYLLDLGAGQAKDSDLKKIENNKKLDFFDKSGKPFVFDNEITIDGKTYENDTSMEKISEVITNKTKGFAEQEGGIIASQEKYLAGIVSQSITNQNQITTEDISSLRTAIRAGDETSATEILKKYNLENYSATGLDDPFDDGEKTKSYDAKTLIADYKTVKESMEKFTNEVETITNASDRYDAYAKAGVNIDKMLEGAGMGEQERKTLFGETRQKAQDIIDKDAYGDWFDLDDMTVEEKQEWGERVIGGLSAGFKDMTDEQITKIVENPYGGLAAKTNLSPKVFKKEDGTYDRELVYNAFLNYASKMDAATTKESAQGGSAGESVDELSRVIADHETAFREMVSSIQREIQTAKSATYGNQVSLQ